jgi:hypothetical protein
MQHPSSRDGQVQDSAKDQALMAHSNTEQLKNMVAALASTDPFTKEQVERLSGVTLQASPVSPDGQFFYEAPLAEGAFSAVQLRHSAPTQTNGYALVVLDLRPDDELTVANLEGRLFPSGADRSFNRKVPPDGVVTYIVERPGLTARFDFGAVNNQLMTISFRRTTGARAVNHA